MALNILASLIWGRSTVKVSSYIPMVLSTRASGKIIRYTERVYAVSHLVMYMMEIGPTTKFMVSDVLLKLMVIHTTEIGSKASVTVKVRKLWQTKKNTKVNGRMICAMVKVFFAFWKMEKQLKHTRASSTMESFRVLVGIHTQMAMSMKAHLSMRRNKVKVNTPVLTELCMRVITMMRCATVTECSLAASLHTKVTSKMTCLMAKVS